MAYSGHLLLCYALLMLRLPALDGVRGVAALTVLVGHAANEGFLPAMLGHGSGQMAVGIFFVLSGFLMAYLYAHRPVSEMPAYAVHRIARVVPLYLAIVLVSIVVRSDVIWTFPVWSPDEVALHLLFLHGVRTLWTIPVEIQFYLLFCLVWARPKAAFPLLIALQGIAIGVLVLAGAPTSTLPFWLHFFLLGSLAGLIWRRSGESLLLRANAHPTAGWILLGVALVALPGLRYSLGIPLLPNFLDPLTVLGALSLFFGALLQLGPFRVLEADWARWLGRVSYGIYLIHFPVLMTLERWALPAWSVFPLTVASTLALAALSFHFFEEPLRRRLVSWATFTRAKGQPHAIAPDGRSSGDPMLTEARR